MKIFKSVIRIIIPVLIIVIIAAAGFSVYKYFFLDKGWKNFTLSAIEEKISAGKKQRYWKLVLKDLEAKKRAMGDKFYGCSSDSDCGWFMADTCSCDLRYKPLSVLEIKYLHAKALAEQPKKYISAMDTCAVQCPSPKGYAKCINNKCAGVLKPVISTWQPPINKPGEISDSDMARLKEILVFKKKEEKSPTLCVAVQRGNFEEVKSFVAEGADVNERCDGSKPKNAPLLIAMERGDSEIVEFLLSKGANIDTMLIYDGSFGYSIPIYGNLETLKVITEQTNTFAKDKGPNKLAQFILGDIVFKNDMDSLKYLLSKGIDINARGDGGDTMLINAARHGNEEMVKLLVENKADINVKTRRGKSALDEAALNAHVQIADYLLSNGALSQKPTYDVSEEFVWAAMENNLNKVKVLHEAEGVDVNIENPSGGFAIYWAACNGWMEMAKYLVDNGADVNAYSARNGYPLACAEKQRYQDMAAFLKEHGAISEKPPEGQ